jgi:hypothetical protein
MRNRKECIKCMFRGGTPGMEYKLFCNYSGITDKTCLRAAGKGVIDIRGTDKTHCQLFREGHPSDYEGE